MTIEQAFAACRFRQFDLAFELLQPLAEQGNPDAQAMLGSLHELGLGTTRDWKIAKHWYLLLASEQGSPMASNNLAGMFEKQGDYKAAERYYKLAQQQDLVHTSTTFVSSSEQQWFPT